MFKVRGNSAPKINFRCMLRCAGDRAPVLAKPDIVKKHALFGKYISGVIFIGLIFANLKVGK